MEKHEKEMVRSLIRKWQQTEKEDCPDELFFIIYPGLQKEKEVTGDEEYVIKFSINGGKSYYCVVNPSYNKKRETPENSGGTMYPIPPSKAFAMSKMKYEKMMDEFLKVTPNIVREIGDSIGMTIEAHHHGALFLKDIIDMRVFYDPPPWKI